MSDNRHYKGTLTEIKPLEGECLESLCKRILDVDHLDMWYDTYAEQLSGEKYDEYYINKNKVYKIDKREYDSNDIFSISKTSQNTYSFEVLYYDGGCCFTEALDECFERNEV